MDMFTSYGHINKLKKKQRFFKDFRPGHVPLNKVRHFDDFSFFCVPLDNILKRFSDTRDISYV